MHTNEFNKHPQAPDNTITLRLFSPLHAVRYEPQDGQEEEITLDGKDLAGYEPEIRAMIDTQQLQSETVRGLMVYFRDDQSVENKVISAFPSIETYDGTLYGILDCRLTEPLQQEELQILKEYWLGQMSDGWGEGFEQQEIPTNDGDIYVSFWTGDTDFRIMTEPELKNTGPAIEQQKSQTEEPGMGISLM